MKQCKYKIYNPHTNETICSWLVKDEDPVNFPFSDICIGRIKIVKED